MAKVIDLDSFRTWAAGHIGGLTYIGPDPHHGLGLEKIVPGYRVVSSRAPVLTALARAGTEVLDLDRADLTDASTMLGAPESTAFINGAGSRPPIFVFKSSVEIESRAQDQGWHLLTSPAPLARRWENKVAFARRAAALGLPIPEWRIVSGAGALEDARVELGGDVVVQAPHGYGGARTIRAQSSQEAAAAAHRLRSPELRVGPMIDGVAWTLNACVTARGIAVSAPTLQLTGLPALTTRPFGACGNDGTVGTPAAGAMLSAARKVGVALAEDGYAGLFGVDFVVDAGGAAWIIEVNPRLVSSIGLATQLEIGAGCLPLLARHFVALVEPDADAAPLDLAADTPLEGSQMVLHNLGGGQVTAHADLAFGAWGSRGAVAGGTAAGHRARTGGGGATSVNDVGPGEWLLIPGGARPRVPGAEVARMQRRGPVAGRHGGLEEEALAAANAVYAALELETSG